MEEPIEDSPIPPAEPPIQKLKRYLRYELKFFFLGFITPFALYLFFLILSPALLVDGGTKENLDALIIESKELPKLSRLTTASNLYKKKKVKRIILVLNKQLENKALTGVAGLKENYLEESFNYLVNRGVLPEMVHQVFSPDHNFQPGSNARSLVRLLVSHNVQSVLIQTDPFESRRYKEIYSKILSPLKVRVYTFPEEEPFKTSDWFSSYEGIEHVTGKLFRNFQYKLSGSD